MNEIEQNIVYKDTLLEISPELMKKTIVEQDKEIERLHYIIKEVREYVEEMQIWLVDFDDFGITTKGLLEILDKEN